MIATGVLVRVERTVYGTSTLVDAAAGATALVVDWLDGFDVDDPDAPAEPGDLGGGLLAIGDADPVAYVAAVEDDDTGDGTITLAAPLAASVPAGTPVAPLDDNGAPLVKWLAWVAVTDADGAEEEPWRIDSPERWREGDSQAGMVVTGSLDEADPDPEWVVTSQGPAEPVLDLAYADTDRLRMHTTVNYSVPDTAWTQYDGGWVVDDFNSDSIVFDPATLDVVCRRAATHLVVATVSFDINSSGSRGLRVVRTPAGGADEVWTEIITPASTDRRTTVQVVAPMPVDKDDRIHVEALQTSGAGLLLLPGWTRISVTRLSAI